MGSVRRMTAWQTGPDRSSFSKFSAARLAAMLAVTLVLIGFFEAPSCCGCRSPPMSVLFSPIFRPEDVNAILKDLGHPRHQVRAAATAQADGAGGQGRTCRACGSTSPCKGNPSWRPASATRSSTRAMPFPRPASSRTSIILRALEGEAQARTIRLDRPGAGGARPPRHPGTKAPVRARRREPPRRLDRAQARRRSGSQRRCKCGAPPRGLRRRRSEAGHVSIVDERGRLWPDGAQGERGPDLGSGIEERQTAIAESASSHRSRTSSPASSAQPGGRVCRFPPRSRHATASRAAPRPSIPEAASSAPAGTATEELRPATKRNNGTVTVGNELPGAQQAARARTPRTSARNLGQERGGGELRDLRARPAPRCWRAGGSEALGRRARRRRL